MAVKDHVAARAGERRPHNRRQAQWRFRRRGRSLAKGDVKSLGGDA
jgi:hypothetical protein